jgi:hypothetical protein
MSFFDTAREKSANNFRKTEHIDLQPGQSTIRIIDTPEEAHKYQTHYLKGIYVKCIGEDCPICRNNVKIYAENPENFREIPGYSAKSERYAVNVFDKTSVKICANCKAEVKKFGTNFPPVCPHCNQPIVTVKETPLNKIKVLAKGVTVANLLNGIDESVQDKEGNKIGVNNFDLVLYVTGTGRDQNISIIPLIDQREPVNYAPQEKFDLTKIAIELTPEEIGDIQRGVSLKDIFASRRAVVQVPAEEAGKPAEIADDVKKQIADILK